MPTPMLCWVNISSLEDLKILKNLRVWAGSDLSKVADCIHSPLIFWASRTKYFIDTHYQDLIFSVRTLCIALNFAFVQFFLL